MLLTETERETERQARPPPKKKTKKKNGYQKTIALSGIITFVQHIYIDTQRTVVYQDVISEILYPPVLFNTISIFADLMYSGRILEVRSGKRNNLRNICSHRH